MTAVKETVNTVDFSEAVITQPSSHTESNFLQGRLQVDPISREDSNRFVDENLLYSNKVNDMNVLELSK